MSGKNRLAPLHQCGRLLHPVLAVDAAADDVCVGRRQIAHPLRRFDLDIQAGRAKPCGDALGDAARGAEAAAVDDRDSYLIHRASGVAA